jgi:uncharacterized protein YyaL (SSP411 family)
MNENFINIKVDREERPDLDAIYMAVVQMVTGGGGWPMTVFLTPDQTPFFCGTYFPPEDAGGRPGFRKVIIELAKMYRERKQDIVNAGDTIKKELGNLNLLPEARDEIDATILEDAVSGMVSNYDPRHGGFGQAPKFPPSMTLSFLLRSYKRTGNETLLDIVRNTLIHMACGGIYDQLGGGFHRYSVDAEWLVPHFEKMLYDNALLGMIYTDAHLLTGEGFYRRIAEETLDYVLREMASPEGGFYASQDADSEGQEGAFFLWSYSEVQSLLDAEAADIFCRYFGITPEGDFEGINILNIPRSGDVVAKLCGISEQKLLEVVREGKRILFEARQRRVRPGRDDKILTAWNGLMLKSFAEAANAFGCEDYRAAAARNAEFLLSKLQSDGYLLRSFKNGRARFNGYLEDYAYLIDGLLSLYEAVFDPRWIAESERLADTMVRDFWDNENTGFYFTARHHESLIHRPKEFYDHATPSGNSVAASALLRLWKLTGDERWAQYPVSIFKRLSTRMRQQPAAFAYLLSAMDFYCGRPKEIAIIGDPMESDTMELLDGVRRNYVPNKVLVCGINSDVFLLKDKVQIDGRPTAYVCENFTCKAPVTDRQDLESVLSTQPGRRAL